MADHTKKNWVLSNRRIPFNGFRKWILCLVVSLCAIFPQQTVAQINTDHTMEMGRNALFFEDYMLSIQYFNRVIETKPYLAPPYFFRGLAKLRLSDYSGAVTDCSEAIERNPFITDAYQVRAIGHIELKRYQEAVDDYQHVLSVNPRDLNALHNLSLCYMHLKDFEKAEKALEQLDRYATTGKSRIWLMKADCALEQADTTKALTYVDKSLEYDSKQEDAYAFKASVSMKHEKWEQAEEELTRAIECRGLNPDLYVTRALARYYQWKLDKALADYDEAIRINPNHFIAHYNRGLLRMNVGDDNRAIEDFNYILEKKPGNEQALINRGILRLQTGDYQGSIHDFSQIIKEHPNFLAGYQYRAEAYRKAGMTAQAARDEVKLMKANMDMRFGGNNWRTGGKPKPARKITDEDIENYSQVVEEEDTEQEIEYQSPFRGKIQNKNIEQKPEPAFVLSYYKKYNELDQGSTFYKPLEELNRKHFFPGRALLTNQENTLTETQISQRFASIDTLSAQIQKGNKQPTLYLARALDYSLTQNMQAALEDLQRAIQLDSTLVWNYFVQANVKWKLFQLQEEKTETPVSKSHTDKEFQSIETVTQLADLQSILQDIDKTIALAPDLAFAHYNRALILNRMGRTEEAINSYTLSLKLEPTLAEAYFNRGLIKIQNNQQTEGLKDLSRAGEMGIPAAYNLIKRYAK